MKKRNRLLEVLIACVLFAGIIFTLNNVTFTVNEVSGVSMNPTLQNGDRVIVNKIDKIKRFDIVIFQKDEVDNLVKRVIGMPGDELYYDEDVLYINGVAYEEPYLDEAKKEILSGTLTEDFQLIDYTGYDVVPDGYYFILGDNRRNSVDSRILGLVSEEKLIGKAEWLFVSDFQLKKIK